MKSTIHVCLCFALFLFWSCSKDDDTVTILQGPTSQELLVNFSPWVFSNYTLLNIIDAGTSDVTENEIEAVINDQFSGLTITFNSDGTGVVSAPQLLSSLTWNLTASGELIMDIQEFDEEDNPVIFMNTIVTETLLTVEEESSYYNEEVDFDVAVYGRYGFQ